jgi:predicted  nucleic acid-binding Zn-ribbon protein
MDDTKAIESLTHEMELTRHEMAALTDALRHQANKTHELTAATNALSAQIEERSKQLGFWQRLAG